MRKTVGITRASIESLNVIFNELYEYLKKNNYSDSDIFYGVTNHHEYHIYSENKSYFYDFTILSKKLIIEYHGSKYHPNKNLLTENKWLDWRCLFSNKSADEIHKNDLLKEQVAKNNGFIYKAIWSNGNNENILKELIKEFKL